MAAPGAAWLMPMRRRGTSSLRSARDDRAHAVVGAGAAAFAQAQGAERQVHVVVDDQDVLQVQAQAFDQRLHGLAAAVHVRLRFGQDHGQVVGVADARSAVGAACVVGPAAPDSGGPARRRTGSPGCGGCRRTARPGLPRPTTSRRRVGSKPSSGSGSGDPKRRRRKPNTTQNGSLGRRADARETRPDRARRDHGAVPGAAARAVARGFRRSRRHVAGAESNVAVGMCRLGGSAGFISRVGDDEFGRLIQMRLRGEGVDVSRLVFDGSAPTGLIVRERREVGPVDVLYYRRGSAASRMSPGDLDPTYVASGRYLILSGITPALSASCRETVFAAAEMARAAGVTVVLDPNMRFNCGRATRRGRSFATWPATRTWSLPGLDEAELLTGETDARAAATALLALGPRLVVVKLGERGALALTAEGFVESPGFRDSARGRSRWRGRCVCRRVPDRAGARAGPRRQPGARQSLRQRWRCWCRPTRRACRGGTRWPVLPGPATSGARGGRAEGAVEVDGLQAFRPVAEVVELALGGFAIGAQPGQ